MGVLFEIFPLKGVQINGGTKILLGSKIDTVDAALKAHSNMHYDNSYYYYESTLHIETVDGTVSEIEIFADPYAEVRLFGVNPFEHKDEELIEIFNDKLGEMPDIQGIIDESTDVSWKHNGITLWRTSSPKKVLDSAEEARADGYYEQWMKEEYEPSKFFETILIKKAEPES
ncbi:MAG: hypothetical protein K5679_05085 [Lachnospiraceae bacterium]|nr:hypothetical protein [Lachnospiraceae bacterium]